MTQRNWFITGINAGYGLFGAAEEVTDAQITGLRSLRDERAVPSNTDQAGFPGLRAPELMPPGYRPVRGWSSPLQALTGELQGSQPAIRE
jgi:hypothetical protein